MKHHNFWRRTAAGVLSLCLVCGSVPMVGIETMLGTTAIVASAATLANSTEPTTWSEDCTIEQDVTLNGVTVTANITLTIPEGKTLTVNDGINAGDYTLTVEGEGTLIVTGKNGNIGADGIMSGSGGEAGSTGFRGNIIVNGAEVTVKGGDGGSGGKGNDGPGGRGGNGGLGVNGNVIVNSGSLTAMGGSGGAGGNSDATGSGSEGGDGGLGDCAVIYGSVTVNGGWFKGIGGNGGAGGRAKFAGSAGDPSYATSYELNGVVQESNDGTNWQTIDDKYSYAQYVMVTAPPVATPDLTYTGEEQELATVNPESLDNGQTVEFYHLIDELGNAEPLKEALEDADTKLSTLLESFNGEYQIKYCINDLYAAVAYGNSCISAILNNSEAQQDFGTMMTNIKLYIVNVKN